MILKPNEEMACQYNMGKVLMDVGNFQAALEAYRSALRLNPNHPWIAHNYAAALSKVGKAQRDLTSIA